MSISYNSICYGVKSYHITRLSIPSRSYHILYWQHTHNAPTMYHNSRNYWRELMKNANVFSPRNNPGRKWQNSKWKLCNVQLFERPHNADRTYHGLQVLQGHRSHGRGVSSKHREFDCLFHSYMKVTTKTLKTIIPTTQCRQRQCTRHTWSQNRQHAHHIHRLC